MKKLIKTMVVIVATIFITGCSTSYVKQGASAKVRAGDREIERYETVTKTKTVPGVKPFRVEPYEGTWDAERAIDTAESNNIHGVQFKPCRSKPGGEMCESDQPWMGKEEIRDFYRKQGKNSPYCGATWVKGSDATVKYDEKVPVYADSEDEVGGGGNVDVRQTTNVNILPGLLQGASDLLDVGIAAATSGYGYSDGGYYGGGHYEMRGNRRVYCPPPQQYRRPQRPPIMQRPQMCGRCRQPAPSCRCRQHGGYQPRPQQGTVTHRYYYNNETNRVHVVNAPPPKKGRSLQSYDHIVGTQRGGTTRRR